MTIFGSIGIGLLFSTIIIGLYVLVCVCDDIKIKWWLVIILFIVIVGIACCINITVYTEKEKIYVEQYLAQKQTIEQSMQSEKLTGLERMQLVQQATELNGELAEHRAKYNKWHYVVWGEKNCMTILNL